MSTDRPQAPVDEPQEDWEDAARRTLAQGLPVIPWAQSVADIWNANRTNPPTTEEHTP